MESALCHTILIFFFFLLQKLLSAVMDNDLAWLVSLYILISKKKTNKKKKLSRFLHAENSCGDVIQVLVDMITPRNRNYTDINPDWSNLAHSFTSSTAFLKNTASKWSASDTVHQYSWKRSPCVLIILWSFHLQQQAAKSADVVCHKASIRTWGTSQLYV